jgi:hypothetical protein
LQISEKIGSEGDRAERQNRVAQIVRLLYNFEGRPGQIDCVLWMLDKRFDSRDKNVFREELDHAILPCLEPRSIILIILPLLSQGFEQKIRRLSHAARPIFIHGDNINSPNLLRDVELMFYPRQNYSRVGGSEI